MAALSLIEFVVTSSFCILELCFMFSTFW